MFICNKYQVSCTGTNYLQHGVILPGILDAAVFWSTICRRDPVVNC